MAPHIYAISDGAYRAMLTDRQNQSLLITYVACIPSLSSALLTHESVVSLELEKQRTQRRLFNTLPPLLVDLVLELLSNKSFRPIQSWRPSVTPRLPETTTPVASYVSCLHIHMLLLTIVQGKFIEIQFNTAGFISGASIISCILQNICFLSFLWFAFFFLFFNFYFIFDSARSLGEVPCMLAGREREKLPHLLPNPFWMHP